MNLLASFQVVFPNLPNVMLVNPVQIILLPYSKHLESCFEYLIELSIVCFHGLQLFSLLGQIFVPVLLKCGLVMLVYSYHAGMEAYILR